MKWIFIVLLIVNVVYFGWELDRETGIRVRQVKSVLHIPESAEKLRLLSEIETLPEFRPVGSQLPDSVPAVPGDEQSAAGDLVVQFPDIIESGLDNNLLRESCFRFGPVPDELSAKGLYDWFNSRNSRGNIFFTDQGGGQLFWIYLAPQQSRDRAFAVLQDLKDKGIDDTRLINRGDLENAISLGLFSSQAAVNSRLNELKDKGFTPIVVPYANVSKIYWLDVVVTESTGVIEDMINGYPARYKSVPVSCDSISNSVSQP